MSYYMGDFYMRNRGDYYPRRGDPGFFSVLGGLAKAAVGAIPGVGPIISSVGSAIGSVVARPGVGTLAAKAGGAVEKVGSMVKAHPVLTAAGAAGLGGALAGAGGAALLAPGGAPPKGFHLCKSKHGCKHGMFVKNRRMRVTNPRALRRAIRRTTGFAKLAMRTIHIVHPKKHARFGGFRRKRRK